MALLSSLVRFEQGTAIGTKMAPSYAILFMDALERGILDGSELKPSVWWRYIDDVFLIWEHGEESSFLTISTVAILQSNLLQITLRRQ